MPLARTTQIQKLRHRGAACGLMTNTVVVYQPYPEQTAAHELTTANIIRMKSSSRCWWQQITLPAQGSCKPESLTLFPGRR